MARTRIKFCGITSAADAVAAAEWGADAIGLVLHAESRRRISVTRAREIVRALPPFVTPVGLFVNASAELIQQVADEVGLGHVQLHGEETPEFASKLTGFRVIKAIRVSIDSLASCSSLWSSASVAAVLLDSGAGSQAGGTGIENDWDSIAMAFGAGILRASRTILAGGLHPKTVGPVVRRLRPYAVDVSSGIEQSPGIKDVAKMRDFVQAVRDADSL